MAPPQAADGAILADKDESVLRGVLVPHAIDAPLMAVSVPRPSVSNDGVDHPSGKGSPTVLPSQVEDAFLSLISPTEVFPGDEVAVTSVSSPFASRVGLPIAIIYNEGSKAPSNMRASRLTMALESGVVTQIHGGALVLGCAVDAVGGEATAQGGSDSASRSKYSSVSSTDLGAMDNALHDEVMEYFCQGLVPKKEDLDRILAGFRAGGFRYTAYDDQVGGDGVEEKEKGKGKDGNGSNDKHEKTQRKGRKHERKGKHDGKEQELPGWGGDGNWS